MKKWWGIRHIRYFYLKTKFIKWWVAIGQYLGAVPNPADLEHLDRIWRGEE